VLILDCYFFGDYFSRLMSRLLIRGQRMDSLMKDSHVRNHCPRCGGNLFLYNDYDGWYEQCLQCSLVHYLKVDYESDKKEDERKSSEINQSTVSGA
jgi:predicted  nucleic acid-binding Zn-ribbon protein